MEMTAGTGWHTVPGKFQYDSNPCVWIRHFFECDDGRRTIHVKWNSGMARKDQQRTPALRNSTRAQLDGVLLVKVTGKMQKFGGRTMNYDPNTIMIIRCIGDPALEDVRFPSGLFGGPHRQGLPEKT